MHRQTRRRTYSSRVHRIRTNKKGSRFRLPSLREGVLLGFAPSPAVQLLLREEQLITTGTDKDLAD